MPPIDQDRRNALCRRILDGDLAAARELGELYRAAGYVSLGVPLSRAGAGDAHAAGYVRHHALTVLGLPLDSCTCRACRP
jgi:hypothetical protein